MRVEDKASGTGLIQSIRSKAKIPIKGIERTKDKYTRLTDVQGYIESGYVMIPEEAPFVSDFLAECEAFTADDSHMHDDQIDPMIDAINDMLAHNSEMDLLLRMMS
jgi:predicted phage terminase large subunit-like protein